MLLILVLLALFCTTSLLCEVLWQNNADLGRVLYIQKHKKLNRVMIFQFVDFANFGIFTIHILRNCPEKME